MLNTYNKCYLVKSYKMKNQNCLFTTKSEEAITYCYYTNTILIQPFTFETNHNR